MKARLLMIAALGLVLGACNRQATAKTPKTDLERLQGTWNLVSAIQDGNALPEDKVKQTTIVFKGDTFRFPGSAEYATSRAGTIKLDEMKTPKEMDAISTEKEVMLGIYALEENGYKVCFAPAGKPRPTEFTSTPREWPDPPGLGAAEKAIITEPRVFGAVYYQTSPPRWSRLNRVAVVFEYEVDAHGNTHSEGFYLPLIADF
jgi:uncharacterized protein (TIGR03067 family)